MTTQRKVAGMRKRLRFAGAVLAFGVEDVHDVSHTGVCEGPCPLLHETCMAAA